MAKKINIKGVIISNDLKWIYDWFEMDSTCPRDVEKGIEEANGSELEVVINSPGGDVFSGSEIYTLLKSYEGNSVGKIVGVAASAAGIAAMGVKRLLMSPTAELMMHNVSMTASGDYREMEHRAQMLKDYNSTLANAYMLKSGMNKEELLDMMNRETWLTPEKALKYNLIDEIMFDEGQLKLTASVDTAFMIPEQMINKIRNLLRKAEEINPLNSEKNEADIFMQQKAQAQLRLLKLGGKDIE